MRKPLQLAAALLSTSLLAATAHATPMIGVTVSSGGSSEFFSGTVNAGGGFAVQPASVGNFYVSSANVSAQPSKLFPNRADYIDLSSLVMSSTSGGTLTITVTATGYTSPVGVEDWLTQLTGNITGGVASVTAASYIDNTDTLDNPACAVSCSLLSTVGLGQTATAQGTSTAPFALTEVITIVAGAGENISIDSSVVDAPEPASLAVLGMGLVGIGAIRRRRA